MLTDISSESVAAVLPLYLTSALGLSTVAYGFVDGIYQGVSAVTRIAAGYTADRQDRPKAVAIAGYGLSLLARVGLLLSHGIGQITTVVTADRIGKGIRTAPRDAMIAASSTSENVGRSFGVHRALDTLGAVVGPLLAFGILWWIVDGYRVVMVVSLAFAAMGFAVLVLLVPNLRPGRSHVSREPGNEARVSLRAVLTPELRRLLLVVGGLSVVTVGDGFLYLALMDRSDFATHWFPMLYVGTNAAYMTLAIPFGRFADRFGRVRTFIAGHGFLLGAYVCAALPGTGATATVLTLMLLGAFYAGTDGVLSALAGRVSPVRGRASGIAAAQTVVAVARLVSSTTFGVLWYVVGPTTGLLAVGAVLALLVVPALVALRPVQAVTT